MEMRAFSVLQTHSPCLARPRQMLTRASSPQTEVTGRSHVSTKGPCEHPPARGPWSVDRQQTHTQDASASHQPLSVPLTQTDRSHGLKMSCPLPVRVARRGQGLGRGASPTTVRIPLTAFSILC